MGIESELRDERGTAVRGIPDPNGGVFDAAGDLDRLIPYEVGELRLLRHVDPYGYTVFNGLQMVDLLADIDQLTEAMDVRLQPIEQRGLARLRAMAERCRDEVHLYLWFVGD